MCKKLVLLSCLVLVVCAEIASGGCEPFLLSDFDEDCYVNFRDFARLASYWLESCDEPGDCEWVDIYTPGGDGIVDINDLNEFVTQWLLCTDTANPDCEALPPYIAEANLYEPPNALDSPANPTYGVNPATGEYRETVVDLRIPGRGLDFIWSRTYRSRTGSNTSTGNNWDYSYNIYIEPAGRDFIVHDGSGRRDLYRHQADGTWVTDGLFRVLSRNPDLSFSLTFPDKTTWIFNRFDGSSSQGKIKQITDRNGNAISFDYRLDDMGKLATVRDTLGREIDILYDADGSVAFITDFAGRTVSYQYYDGNTPGGSLSDLKSVTTPAVTGTLTGNDYPDGKTTTYTYSHGLGDERLNHNLLTITDPNGRTFLQNVYSPTTDSNDPEFDHVIRQIWGEPNDIIDITYVPQAPDAGNNFAVVKTVTNDRVGNVASHFFDDRNRLVMVRQYTGRADPNSPTYLDPNTNPPVNKLRADDPAYFETRYEYNSDSLVTRIDYPNGNYVVNVYEADLDPNASQRSRGNLRAKFRHPGPMESTAIVDDFESYNDSNNLIYDTWIDGLVNGTGSLVDLAVDPCEPVNQGKQAMIFDYNNIDPPYYSETVGTYSVPQDWAASGAEVLEVSFRVGTGTDTNEIYVGLEDSTGTLVWVPPGVLCCLLNLCECPPDSRWNPIPDDDWFLFAFVLQDFADGGVDLTAVSKVYIGLGDRAAPVPGGSGTIYIDDIRMISPIIEKFEYGTEFGGECSFATRHVDPRRNETLHDYDPNGNRIRTTYVREAPDANIVQEWQYNAYGQRTVSILPDNGSGHRRRDVYTYYTDCNDPNYSYLKETIVDANNLALTTMYEYDAVGNTIRLIDPNGSNWRYIHNQLNQVVCEISPEVTDGSGVCYKKYTFYDKNNNVVRVDIENIDDQGNLQANEYFTTTYEYDTLNNLVRVTAEVNETHSVVTEYEYDENCNRTLIRFGEATNGNQPTNTIGAFYDELTLPLWVIRAEGNQNNSAIYFEYDGVGNCVKVHDGGWDVVVTTYKYVCGQLVKTNRPMNYVTTNTYDAIGNRIHTTFGPGCNDYFIGDIFLPPHDRLNATSYKYDELNRLVETEVDFFDVSTTFDIGDGKVTTGYEYNDNSQVTKVTDDNGNETHYEYDTANRLSVVIDAKGNKITYSYDENSNVIAVTVLEKSDLGGPDETFVTTYKYDNLNRLTGITDNAGNTTQYAYDSRDNRTRMIDARNTEIRSAYDGLNRLTWIVRDMDGDGANPSDSDDIKISQTWDDTSRLTSLTDDKCNITTYEYDPLNRLIKTTYADSTSRQGSYDVHDNLIQTIDAAGSVVDYTYDDLNRLIEKYITPGAGVSDQTTFEYYQYDNSLNLVGAGNDYSVVARSYDSLSNIIQETLNGVTTTSSYDGLGNKLSCTYPSGRAVNYTYDALNRIKTISDAGGTIASYNYIGPRRPERRDYVNNTRTTYTYDNIRRITQTTHTRDPAGTPTIIDDRTYTWDATYNKTQRKDIRAGGPQLTHDYTYDSIDRLVHTTVTNTVPAVVRDTGYSLDGIGNRTSVTGSPDPGIYTMDSATPEPADEQVNQYTTTSFDSRLYDKNGNLNTIDNGLSTQKGLTYDYLNRMVRFEPANFWPPIVHTYSYDCFGRRIERIVDSEGTPQTTRYFYDGWQVIEERNGAGVTQATYVYGNYIDEVLNMQRGANDYYYHTDELFNVMAVTDVAGNAVERYEYQDYGKPEFFNGAGVPIAGTAIGNPYYFTGRRYDSETGLYYYRTRYLDPRSGRFTTRDTIGIWADPFNVGNGYAYVGNNPYSFADPFGMLPPWLDWLKGQAIEEGIQRGLEWGLKALKVTGSFVGGVIGTVFLVLSPLEAHAPSPGLHVLDTETSGFYFDPVCGCYVLPPVVISATRDSIGP
ncbi:MAG: RHS repeat protein [Sedimentisphaerales bacterium]|nr:RHS repeat protein [Sedimentisphaerales bacterium]